MASTENWKQGLDVLCFFSGKAGACGCSLRYKGSCYRLSGVLQFHTSKNLTCSTPELYLEMGPRKSGLRLTRSHGWAQIHLPGVLIRRGNLDARRRHQDVGTQEKGLVMDTERRQPSASQERCLWRWETCWHLEFGLLASRTVRKWISIASLRLFCYATLAN